MEVLTFLVGTLFGVIITRIAVKKNYDKAVNEAYINARDTEYQNGYEKRKKQDEHFCEHMCLYRGR